jgi:hypothetical protein
MPCRPGMSGCYRGCRHRAFVQEYQAARSAGEEARDEAVGTYGPGSPEWADYVPPPIVFKDWLVQTTGRGE